MTGRYRQAGFTLVEAMVGLVILSIIMVALGGTFLVGYTTISREASAIAADTAVTSASFVLSRDMTSSIKTSSLPATISPGSGSLNFQYGSPSVSATYTIDANLNLLRTTGGAASVVARGVQQMTVSAAGCVTTITILPSANGAAAQTLTMSQRVGAAGTGCF
jgi:prepilin-type N-terminal cleavage/methylation domain-containing protein